MIKMTKDEMIEYGKWVRSERLNLGLSLEDFANRVNLAKGSVKSIETGTANAVGARAKNSIDHFIKNPHIVAFHTLKDTNNSGLEHFKPILSRIAEIIVAEDFNDKIKTIATTASISLKEACLFILENALKK